MAFHVQDGVVRFVHGVRGEEDGADERYHAHLHPVLQIQYIPEHEQHSV